MAHLPDLGRLPLRPTGVTGEPKPNIWWEEEPSIRKRVNMEYSKALKDRDAGLENTVLTWTYVSNADDTSKRSFEWTFYIDKLYEIVVNFPHYYPFDAPHYYIKTFGGVKVDVKEYLDFVARRKDRETQKYVDSIIATDLDARHEWDTSKNAIDYVKRVVNDPLIGPLLREASMTYVSQD